MTVHNGIVLRHAVDTAEIQGNWIWDVCEGAWENGVTCFFRRTFSAGDVGKNTILRISADSRYRAFINGGLVSRGPCRGLVEFYHYETVDIGEYLNAGGENILAVEVRWYGRRFEPRSEAHLTPGLWAMIGSKENPAAIVTDATWRVHRSAGHTMHAIVRNHPVTGWYHAVDPIEDVDYSKIDPNWMLPGFDDHQWSPATVTGPAIGRYQAKSWFFSSQELIPRAIPMMEELPVPIHAIHQMGELQPSRPPKDARQIDGTLVPGDVIWEDVSKPLTLEGAKTHYIIINMGEITTGYPRLTIDAPAGTMVEFRYAEALTHNFKKTVRDDPAGTVEGYYDIFTCRQGTTVIEPFVWRTFWFMRIAIHHPAGSVRLEKLETIFTAYPFRQRATFESSDPFYKKLWDVSWRTLRLCAHEHFEDCPYYEQIQYVYDTRLEALVSYLTTGDFRLARQALLQFAQSRRNDGITMGRSPSIPWEPVIIPTLSLILIEFLEDFYRYSGDRQIVEDLWPVVEGVLRWFEQFKQGEVLDNVPYWVFSDWTLPFDGKHIAGSTGDLNMRWIGAMKAAGRLAKAINKDESAARLTAQAQKATESVRKCFWSDKNNLFLDETDGRLVAEHASILAIVHDVVDADQGRTILRTLESRNDLAKMSIAYEYYVFRAYDKMGMYDRVYDSRLHHWTDQLKLHATTWFETGEPTRSDCHGWGSWIMAELLTNVLGITPLEPGFTAVQIKPHFLNLTHAKGSIPTARGPISVEWTRKDGRVQYAVTIPPDVTGILVTPEKEIPLAGGRQVIESADRPTR